MSKLIDKITFEVEADNHLERWRDIILSFEGITLARVSCKFGRCPFAEGKNCASIVYIKYDKAPYFSLGNNEIYSLVKDFILGGGFGVKIDIMN